MSIHVSSIVWRTALGGPSIKAVAMKLADCAHDDGTSVWPSVATIARETEVSERTVQYALKDLVGRGVLVVVEHGGKGRRNTTEYAFDLQVLNWLHRETMERWRAEDEAKGADSAPLRHASRVQRATAQGAAGARKGAAAAPEPSRTIKEPARERAKDSNCGLSSEVEVPIMARRGTPQHQRWLEYYRKTGQTGPATFAATHDVQVPTKWPPKADTLHRTPLGGHHFEAAE